MDNQSDNFGLAMGCYKIKIKQLRRTTAAHCTGDLGVIGQNTSDDCQCEMFRSSINGFGPNIDQSNILKS